MIDVLPLADGAGAVLVDMLGIPLPVPPRCFRDRADAEQFVRWIDGPVSNGLQLRELAKRWQVVRDQLRCPTCETGRVPAGDAICETCAADVEHERLLNHEREPGRNETEFACEGVRLAAEGLTR